jgi:hypothetical protein
VVRLMPRTGSGLLSSLSCEEPGCQKHRNFADPHSKNEHSGNEEVTTVAAAVHLPRVTEAALSQVEGCPSWLLGRLVMLRFPHSAHKSPEGNQVCCIPQLMRDPAIAGLGRSVRWILMKLYAKSLSAVVAAWFRSLLENRVDLSTRPVLTFVTAGAQGNQIRVASSPC